MGNVLYIISKKIYDIKTNITAPNKRLALTALDRRFGFRKTPVGLHPLWPFGPPHFCSPGLASQALIWTVKTSPI